MKLKHTGVIYILRLNVALGMLMGGMRNGVTGISTDVGNIIGVFKHVYSNEQYT
tara:strand:+ start:911 stop:1072 length:162 start_codon:yes stop_codon:yes gene_type:complete